MLFKPRCLPTALGSLPFKDVDKAISFVVKYFPDVPFWPQLPRRSFLEGMNLQFSENIEIIELRNRDLVLKNTTDQEIAEFYEKRILNKDYNYFSISKDYAFGFYKLLEQIEKGYITSQFIKGHVTGPFTFSASIKADIPVISEPFLLHIITSSLTLKTLWQIKKIKSLGKKVILFFDEPYLACFGSAFTPLGRTTVIRTLTELISPLKEEDVLIGVHCCGNTDWPIFIESGFDIISFDAYNYLDKVMLYTKELKAFLLSGGILALGIVPTQDFDPSRINVDLLLKKIQDGLLQFSSKGIDEGLILEQALLTPSCGMATLDETKTVEISNVLSGLSFSLKKKYF